MVDFWFHFCRLLGPPIPQPRGVKQQPIQWGISSQILPGVDKFLLEHSSVLSQMNSRNWIKHDFFSGDSNLVIIGRMNCWMSSFFSVQTVESSWMIIVWKNRSFDPNSPSLSKKMPCHSGVTFRLGTILQTKKQFGIRRPRQTQGGARQGIRLLTLVSDYYHFYSIG